MAIYKDVESLEVIFYKSVSEDFDKGVKYILEKIDALPTADVVEAKAIEQLKWERDAAIEQLQSYGVGFGEDKELAEVKHGKWRLETDDEMPDPMFKLVVCYTCNKTANNTYNYCPNCGTKMYSKKE